MKIWVFFLSEDELFKLITSLKYNPSKYEHLFLMTVLVINNNKTKGYGANYSKICGYKLYYTEPHCKLEN